ncbi:MAG: SGNH/GDSL hydrolase family protein [Deltaproteobacteria bacterium]|nr:SGNH/GDSL hydrolase family protein [Deltaproteobacteria bacterium]
MKQKAILLTVSVLVCLFVGEVFCRIMIGRRLIPHQEENGLYYFKPGQRGWYLLGFPPAKINNLGARGENVDVPAAARRKKFLFFGDSFTFGWMVADDETIPHIFMKEMGLTPEEVLNFGNGGFGIDHMKALYLRQRELWNRRDTIIAILIAQDLNRPMRPPTPSRLKEAFWRVRSKSSFISWGYVVSRNAWLRWRPSPADEPSSPPPPPLTSALLERQLLPFARLVGGSGQELIFIFYEFKKSAYSDRGGAFCAKYGLVCMTDVWRHTDKVRKEGNGLYAWDEAHPSAVLNQEVGKAIARFIDENSHSMRR